MNVIFFGWAYLKAFSALEKSDPELFFSLIEMILISLVSILADQVKLKTLFVAPLQVEYSTYILRLSAVTKNIPVCSNLDIQTKELVNIIPIKYRVLSLFLDATV